MSRDEFRLIRDLIRAECGFSVADERDFLLANRLAPRLAVTGARTYSDYYRLLKYDVAGERQHALDAMTNNETYFFREQAQLDAVVELARAAAPGTTFSVLSAGCSSGEEAYSVVMLMEQAGIFERGLNVRVVGVDVNERVLAKARRAEYGPHSFRGCEGGYSDWYFRPSGDLLKLDQRLADRVVFRRANLLDPSLSSVLGRFDAVLCRNVIIYFEHEDKARAVANLESLLADAGRLFLGHSESLYNVPTTLAMERMGAALCYRRPGRESQRAAS